MFTKQKAKKICLIAALLVLMICAAILGIGTAYSGGYISSPSTEMADTSTKAVGYTAKLLYSADGSTVTGVDINDTETSTNKDNLAIVIPATSPSGTNVTAIGDSAFTMLTITDGRKYTSLDMSGATNLETIGNNAFQYCSDFGGGLTIPDSVTKIEQEAFRNCSGFAGSLGIGSSVTSIGDRAFFRCSGFAGGLTIPDNVISIGNHAFNGCTGFNDGLTIGNSVTSIGDSAFSGCTGFTDSLAIPNSVTSIGGSAFEGCSGFTGNLGIGSSVTSIGFKTFFYCTGFTGSLTIPDSVTKIEQEAFSNCNGFDKGLTIGSSVTSIGFNAFYDCKGFKGSLTIGSSVTNISEGAFRGCSGFDGSLTILGSVTSIGNYAFNGCSGFTGSLAIPDSVTSIGYYAFRACSGFDGSLTIADSVTSIGFNAFEGCTALGTIYLPNNTATTYDTDVFYRVICPIVAATEGQYTTYKTAGHNLAKYNNLTYAISVTFDAGNGTFVGSNSSTILQDKLLNFPLNYELNTATNIWAQNLSYTLPTAQRADYIFKGFTETVDGTAVVSESSNVTASTYYAIYALKFNAIFNNGSYIITGFSQDYLDSLTAEQKSNIAIVIPAMYNNGVNGEANVTAIGDGAFEFKMGFVFTSLDMSGATNLTTIDNKAFNGCSGLTGDLTIPSRVTYIGEQAFSDCSGFDGSLTIGSGVTDIGGYAFFNCSGFKGNLGIGSSVTYIGGGAFNGCSGFDGSLTIPSSVTSIDEATFNGCSGFDGSLTILGSVTSIGNYAFNNCSGFAGSLTIPASVISIGESAFGGCSGFDGSLTIPASVIFIGETAFYDCNGLTGNLTIPDSVTSIGEAAFYGCIALGTIYLPNNTATTYDTDVFFRVICPIVAATEGQYTTYKTAGHNLAKYNNLTYAISVTFDAGNGTFVGSNSSTILQDKLLNLPLNYELNVNTNIWEQNLSYTLPTVQRADYIIFNGFVDMNGNSITTTTNVLQASYTASYTALVSITATFTQGGNTIYTTATLDSLKKYLTVTGLNNDGTAYSGIIDYTLSGTLTVGNNNTITVTVNGTQISTTFDNVIVTLAVLNGISITVNPSKTNYTAFEDFDRAGMVVEAHYNYGTVVISDYIIVGGTRLIVGTTTLTISYTYNGATVTDTVSITVAKKQLIQPTFGKKYTYSGTEQTAIFSDFDDKTMNITGNTATNAGSYSAIVSLLDTVNYEWTNGTNENITIEWSIAKANYDLSGIVFEDKTVKENGDTHTLILTGTLPSGLTVNYTGTNGYIVGGVIAAGSYEITATFSVDDAANYNIPEAMRATLTINIAALEPTVEEGFPGWAIAIIVIVAILLLLLLLLLLLFLFRKDKEVGGKEYCVSLGSKIKGVFVKNKKTNDIPQDSTEEGQDGAELEMEKREPQTTKTDSKKQ